MNLVALPAFSDNYIWVLHDGQSALVVDPGDAAPVRRYLGEQGLALDWILVTHHHADHVGGLAALQADHVSAETHQPADEPIPGCGKPVRHGDRWTWKGLCLRVVSVPGHTRGHLAFLVEFPNDSRPPILFCGDTLFSGGCGRLFEGSPTQMAASLDQLAALKPDTQVCCAHEYTLANLRFALTVEPDNRDLIRHAANCQALRATERPTLPTTLATELLINPFLRCKVPAVIDAAVRQSGCGRSTVEVFTALREWKNQFR